MGLPQRKSRTELDALVERKLARLRDAQDQAVTEQVSDPIAQAPQRPTSNTIIVPQTRVKDRGPRPRIQTVAAPQPAANGGVAEALKEVAASNREMASAVKLSHQETANAMRTVTQGLQETEREIQQEAHEKHDGSDDGDRSPPNKGFNSNFGAKGVMPGAVQGSGNMASLIPVLIVAGMAIFDRGFGYTGLQISGIGNVTGLIALASTSALFIVILTAGYFFLARDRSPGTIVAFSFLVFVLYAVFQIALQFDTIVLGHLSLMLLFYGTVLRGMGDMRQAYAMLSVLILVDAFGYSVLTLLGQDLAANIIPYALPAVMLILTRRAYPDSWFSYLGIVVLVVMALLDPTVAIASQITGLELEIDPNALPSIEEAPGIVVDTARQPIDRFVNAFRETWQQQYTFAVTGKLSEGAEETLGVSINAFEPLFKTYDQTNRVDLSGTVAAATLSEPIAIRLSCHQGFRDRAGAPGLIEPDLPFVIDTRSIEQFSCQFNTREDIIEDDLALGKNRITATAEFNFATLTELNVFLLSESEYQLAQNDETPVQELFDISQSDIVSTYTSGPVVAAMAALPPIIRVTGEDVNRPTLRMSVRKNPAWSGQLEHIQNMFLKVPKGVNLDGDSCIPFAAERITITDNFCSNLCRGAYPNVRRTNQGYDPQDACQDVCQSQFGGEAQLVHDIYNVTIDYLQFRQQIAQADRDNEFRFICRFTPTRAALGVGATKASFELYTRYQYSVDRSAEVNIVESENE